MASQLVYLSIKPTRSSRFNFSDSKELISYLYGLKIDFFKLNVKSSPKGLEFLIAVPKGDVRLAQRHLYAIGRDLSIAREKAPPKVTTYERYRLKGHYAYPLYNIAKADPEATHRLFKHLSQTASGQSIEIELSAQPTNSIKARVLRKKLLNGQTPRLSSPNTLGYILTTLKAFMYLLFGLVRAAVYLIGSSQNKKPTTDKFSSLIKVVNPKSIILLDKLYEPLFKTSLIVKVKAPSQKQARFILDDMYKSLNSFARSSGYQELKIKNSGHDIYSASDLASLFNITSLDLKSGIFKLLQFKSLPLPNELKGRPKKGDVVLGINNYLGFNDELLLKASSRKRHLYITGATGSGKSTLIANSVLQDINSGQGLTLIDPHGDLAEEVKARIPSDRQKDLIYFDPTDPKNMLSINLLDRHERPGSIEYLMEVDQVVENIISLFKKLFSPEDTSGHRIEYILRNSIHTAIEIPGSTIFTIFRLLTDSHYRFEILPKIKDQDLANFWRNELGKAGEYQRVKMTAGVTSKIGRLLFSAPAKNVFGQAKSTLNVSDIINSHKIFICNFSKGKLGDDGSKLFSAAILVKLQIAALSRAKVPTSKRTDHYLYVDEFQNYAPSVFTQLLSEARKYGLYLTMAEQSPSQQDTQTTSIILANVGNVICFRTASPRDESLMLPMFDGYISSSDLNNLPAFNFYLKSVAEEALLPTSGQTHPLSANEQAAIYLKS